MGLSKRLKKDIIYLPLHSACCDVAVYIFLRLIFTGLCKKEEREICSIESLKSMKPLLSGAQSEIFIHSVKQL